jgi:hypothetical protein
MSNKKTFLKDLQFYPQKLPYDFYDCRVRVAPGCYTDCFYNERTIEPGSPEYWGMALRAGYVHYQFEKGLQLGEFTYNLYENKKNKPRKPRTAKISELEAL